MPVLVCYYSKGLFTPSSLAQDGGNQADEYLGIFLSEESSQNDIDA